eukprot:CAMPEP_0197832748 /NCGR_PEP_ID=MMETSP1437-20131217/15955_1 /TAXON_ID=49252 ORGANISM="Eucampia antarctica, Strain CCMP1452" /NCGR_SAMPLE_ID=MMETSP1437 /ASSEMBLY_ACC=CAM_ASM_001096 /LENGTH=307 /DNA_ID=CAMNT_0043436301 /DNA_START=275 /DNA_END=1198 /DNA_ORIENTATION=-
MYQGTYRNKERHAPDLHMVLDRALQNNSSTGTSTVVSKIMVTAGTLQESEQAIELIQSEHLQKKFSGRLFSTVGVHPTRCSQDFGDGDWDTKLQALADLARRGKLEGTVVAMGELGLDYARTEFCPVDVQKRGFIAQLNIALQIGLPLFLHNRDTGTDLLDILKEHYFSKDTENNFILGGVVHSFDDTLELARKFIDLGLYIGINGCSLKKPENLAVVKEIPLNRLMLETDCPWCDIRATHAGHGHIQTKFPTKTEKKYVEGSCVKGRYEPCHIIQVAEVIAGIKGIPVRDVAQASAENAKKLFRMH